MTVHGSAVRDALSMAGSIILASLEEGPEDCFGILEIVMDNVHEERSLHQLIDRLPRLRASVVKVSPLASKLISLIL
jgi:hypothetical protein